VDDTFGVVDALVDVEWKEVLPTTVEGAKPEAIPTRIATAAAIIKPE